MKVNVTDLFMNEEKYKKEADANYLKTHNFPRNRFEIVNDGFHVDDSFAQLKKAHEDEMDDALKEARNADITSMKAKVERQKLQQMSKVKKNKEDAFDRRNIMADGLVHRPDGTILDYKTKKVIDGANINNSM